MKKHIILIISIIFSSCSSIKVEEQIVKDFISEKKLNNFDGTSPTFLIEEAGSNEKTLDYYEMAFLEKDLGLGENKIVFGPRNSNYWPIDLKEIKTLKSIHKKDSLPFQWANKDLNSLYISIIKRNELLSKTNNGTMPLASTGHIISKPILSLDKKHALFTYIGIFATGGIPTEVFLVEKQKGKWKIKAYYGENSDYQPPSWRIKK